MGNEPLQKSQTHNTNVKQQPQFRQAVSEFISDPNQNQDKQKLPPPPPSIPQNQPAQVQKSAYEQQNGAVIKQVGQNGRIIQPKRAIQRKDPKLYQFINEKEKLLVKIPGEIAGEQFIIRDCNDCDIYLLDYSNTVYIDDCIDCRIFVGPVESSVFIRDTYRCKFIIACGQFRTRKCEDCRVLLMCGSQPIIESSIRIGFGCFRGAYPQLAEQLEKAKIDRWCNTWSDIFDFTKNYRTNEKHFYLLAEDTILIDLMRPISEVFNKVDQEYENDIENQIIPFTSEARNKPFKEEALLIFFPVFSKQYDINKLTSNFQPLPNQEQEIMLDDKGDNEGFIVDAPEGLAYYLVKAKHQMLYLDNLEMFKKTLREYAPQNQVENLLSQLLVNDRLQKLFSLYVRTDNEDIDLIGYMRSVISMHFDETPLREACILIKDQPQLGFLANLVFANNQENKEKN